MDEEDSIEKISGSMFKGYDKNYPNYSRKQLKSASYKNVNAENEPMTKKSILSKSSSIQKIFHNSFENQNVVAKDSNSISSNNLYEVNPVEFYYKVINNYIEHIKSHPTEEIAKNEEEIKNEIQNIDPNIYNNYYNYENYENNDFQNMQANINDNIKSYRFTSKNSKHSYADLHKFILKNFDKLQLNDCEHKIFPKYTKFAPLHKVDSVTNLQKSLSVCHLNPSNLNKNPELKITNTINIKNSDLKNNWCLDQDFNINMKTTSFHKKTFRKINSAKPERMRSASYIGFRGPTENVRKLKNELKTSIEVGDNNNHHKKFILMSKKEADRLQNTEIKPIIKKEFKAKTDLTKVFNQSTNNKIMSKPQKPIKLADKLYNKQDSYHMARMKEREEIFKLEVSKNKVKVFNIMKSLNKCYCDNDDFKKHFSMKMTSKMIKQYPLNEKAIYFLD